MCCVSIQRRILYSTVTNFAERFSLDSSKSTALRIIQLCMRQFISKLWGFGVITFSFSHLEGTHLEHGHYNQCKMSRSLVWWERNFSLRLWELYIWLVPDKLIFQGNLWNQRWRSQKRSLSANKWNVTILILSSMVKLPCGHDIRLRRYWRKTVPQNK